MKRKLTGGLFVLLLTAVPAAGQMPEEYLDVEIVKVKPEKRAEFDAINKKFVEAERRNKGDNWVAMETIYGENNVVTYVSSRPSYAAVEKGTQAFQSALNKALGQAGSEKLWRDYNNTIISLRAEFRRRRWDLCYKPPADPAAMAKMVGQARWVRTIVVHVRPGQGLVFESMLKDINAAAEKNNEPAPVLISINDSGGPGGVYYISWLLSSLGDVDKLTPLPKMLGEEGFQNFLKNVAASAERAETAINRFLPELSNPPDEVAAAAPEFWRPKPAAVPKPKAAEGEKAKPAEKQ